MMEKSFKVGQSNELIQGSRVVDLHNEYDFSAISIEGKRTVRILFEPNVEHGRGEPAVTLEFLEVSYLELSPGFGAQVVGDLEEMGYLEPLQREDDFLLSEEQAKKVDHLFFRLDFGYIRIHSREASLLLRSVRDR